MFCFVKTQDVLYIFLLDVSFSLGQILASIGDLLTEKFHVINKVRVACACVFITCICACVCARSFGVCVCVCARACTFQFVFAFACLAVIYYLFCRPLWEWSSLKRDICQKKYLKSCLKGEHFGFIVDLLDY